jgi:hypothetical protein
MQVHEERERELRISISSINQLDCLEAARPMEYAYNLKTTLCPTSSVVILTAANSWLSPCMRLPLKHAALPVVCGGRERDSGVHQFTCGSWTWNQAAKKKQDHSVTLAEDMAYQYTAHPTE